jgi:DNA-binding transcriptional ArsR family regulator
MVVDIALDRRSDQVFHALSDATRRDILRRSVAGSQSISSLARRYPMSIAAVQKHVAVLERAGLVTKERRGREQLVRDNVAALAIARDVLDQLEAVWRARMDRFDEVLAETTAETSAETSDQAGGAT